jgi:hypothetical protein
LALKPAGQEGKRRTTFLKKEKLMSRFRVTTEMKWLQTYYVDADSAEEAARKVKDGDPSLLTEDGRFNWDSEAVLDIEEVEADAWEGVLPRL